VFAALKIEALTHSTA